jgi:hypothetical protein
MRRALFAMLVAASAAAQGNVYPVRDNFIVLGESIGTGAGGVISGTTIMQAMRVSLVKQLVGRHAIDITASRFQAIFPATGRINDLEYANPEADVLVVSWAQLSRSRARGIPNELALGMGVARRNTSEPGRTRDTWVGRVGYDSDPFARWSHADTGVGFHAYLMPANANNMVYVATLGLYFRIG